MSAAIDGARARPGAAARRPLGHSAGPGDLRPRPRILRAPMSRRMEIAGGARGPPRAYCVANSAFVPTVAKLTTAYASGLTIALFTSAFAGVRVGRAARACAGSSRSCIPRRDLATLVAIGALGTGARVPPLLLGRQARLRDRDGALRADRADLLADRHVLRAGLPRLEAPRSSRSTAIAAGIAHRDRHARRSRAGSASACCSRRRSPGRARTGSRSGGSRSSTRCSSPAARYVYGSLVLLAASGSWSRARAALPPRARARRLSARRRATRDGVVVRRDPGVVRAR